MEEKEQSTSYLSIYLYPHRQRLLLMPSPSLSSFPPTNPAITATPKPTREFTHDVMGPDAEFDGSLVEDFAAKMELADGRPGARRTENDDGEKHGDEEEEEEEFSFDCVGARDGFPISADDIFHNGKIRPVFPLFDQSLLFRDESESESKTGGGGALRPPSRNLFFEVRDPVLSSSVSEGPYCTWHGKAAPGTCKKSNSTGSSKLRRFRELVLRSNSDGKDAFVFLHNPHHHNNNNPSAATMLSENENAKVSGAPGKKGERMGAGKVAVKKEKKDETVSSLPEKYYGKKKSERAAMKGVGTKRRSYLPYRQELVGFFTSSSGLSKNVHPF